MAADSAPTDFMPIFDFTEADWRANRTGTISARQLDSLKRIQRRWIVRWAFYTVVSAMVLLSLWSNGSPDVFLLAMFLLILAGLEYVQIRDLVWLRGDRQAERVEPAAGHAHLVRHSFTYGRAFQLNLGEQEFALRGQQYTALQPLAKKGHLIVYYAPRTKVILSAGWETAPGS